MLQNKLWMDILQRIICMLYCYHKRSFNPQFVIQSERKNFRSIKTDYKIFGSHLE